ncbi:hypothetical protein PRZ48_011433 [Zasmidium cellare]|uniref:O-methyltransferase n=1 Tax=Zasmidium cellare TaxID=395010 RepID=A0ABR0E6C3_ZASCE|nr:hypothetical protein PRZ48_011433 [Zasmidium cellare]
MADSILALAADPPQDPIERRALYEAAKKLMFSVESNHDVQHRIDYGGFPLYIANIAIDLGVFKALAKAAGKPWSITDLAQHLECEELLLSRVLRGLVAYGLACSHPDGTYSSNATTVLFAQPGRESGVLHNVLTVLPSMQCLPDYIRDHEYKCPTSGHDTAFQPAFNTSEDLFTYLGSHPRDLSAAIGQMAAQRADQASWIQSDAVFPTEVFELSEKDIADARALMVDVGGGSGHQSIALRMAHPEISGPIILQDLPHTIGLVDKERMGELGIQCMAHDFNTPQPVRGAKVYYLRNILHDWPDDVSLNILKQLRAAVADDSILVVDEIVVTEDKIRWQQVNYDFIMMSVCGALERTEKQWADLMAAAGFQLQEVRMYDGDKGDSLVIGTPA